MPYVSFGGWYGQTYLLGCGIEVLRFEFFRKSIPECHQQQRLLGLSGGDLRGWGEFLDDTQHVLLKHFAGGHRDLVIFVTTDARAVGVAILPYPQRGENHRYAVGTSGEASYRGYGVIAEQANIIGLEQGKVLVEVHSLIGCHLELDFGQFLQCVEECQVLLT